MYNEYLPEYNAMFDSERQLIEHGGRHALTRLNSYACFLEDFVLKHVPNHELHVIREYIHNVHNDFYPTNNIRPFVRTIAH